MSLYREFERDETPFREREGDASPFWAAVGMLALEFAYLDDVVTNVVTVLMGAEKEVSLIVLAGASFRMKLDILGSLAYWHLEVNPGAADPEAETAVHDLLRRCRKSEELRNAYLHSSYVGSKRRKVSARAKRGLREHEEEVSPELMLDVAYYVGNTADAVDVVPLVLGLADHIEHAKGGIRYTLRGDEVAQFRVTNVDRLASVHGVGRP